LHQFDASAITDTISRALAAAGLDTASGAMRGVTDTIRQSLAAAGLMQRDAAPQSPQQHGVTIDGVAHEVPSPVEITPGGAPSREGNQAPVAEPGNDAEFVSLGQFLARSFSNAAGTRAYKLYIPAGYPDLCSEPMPLLVMLHGCTQSPDDFAAGTRMNAWADVHGFLVVYPAQSANANGSNCWNWFRTGDQARDSGEPSLIAGITREVAAAYRVDARRIFVAGMSAGGAMAVVLGATYPDLYAAIGAHSGLPYGAAHDTPSAFAAMKRRGVGAGPANRAAARAIPTIVFHGDRDHTVDAGNGAEIVERATAARSDRQELRTQVHTGNAAGGRSYSRTEYVDRANRPVVEQWVLHGAGHAWSGGSPSGSFTDARGPDASAEMIRFFYAQQRAGTA